MGGGAELRSPWVEKCQALFVLVRKVRWPCGAVGGFYSTRVVALPTARGQAC